MLHTTAKDVDLRLNLNVLIAVLLLLSLSIRGDTLKFGYKKQKFNQIFR